MRIKTKTLSDNTSEAEFLGIFSKNLGERAKEAIKNPVIKVSKNLFKALELAADLSTAAATKIPRAKFIHRVKVLNLGKIT